MGGRAPRDRRSALGGGARCSRIRYRSGLQRTGVGWPSLQSWRTWREGGEADRVEAVVVAEGVAGRRDRQLVAGIVHPVDGASLLDRACRKVRRQRIGRISSRAPKPGDVVGHHLGMGALIRVTVIKKEEIVARRRPDEVVLMQARLE